jgi:hypothetical protein
MLLSWLIGFHPLCRAEAAAVSAIASGSQHKTIIAMSHRIARSQSASVPMNSATYRMGAAFVSICLPFASMATRPALRSAGKLDLPIVHALGRAPWRLDCRTVNVAIVVFGERHGAGLSLVSILTPSAYCTMLAFPARGGPR